MKNKITFLILGLLFFVGSIQAQVAVTLNVATAGTLSALIDSSKKDSITSLTLTGYLNGDDIRFIREMAGSDVNGKVTSGALTELDLSGANIVSGGSYYRLTNNRYYTSSNYISDFMFSGCGKLTSAIIPNSVSNIGIYAFYNCTGLKSFTIPGSVISIEDFAFSGCRGLTSVTIPESLTSVASYAFNNCTGLKSVTIPNSVTSINNHAFSNCTGLTSVIIPGSVTDLGIYAFYGCSGLTQIIVDGNNPQYSSLDGVLFNENRTLLSICPNGKSGQYTVPGSVGSIDYYAFKGCTKLTSVTIPESVVAIGGSAFYGCTGLTSVSIPNSVTSIGGGVFYNCTGLTSVTIPYSVTSIAREAFFGCTGLTEIHCQMEIPPTIDSSAFYYVNKNTCKLYVPKESVQIYKQSDVWKEFTNIVEESITPINEVSLNKASVSTLNNAIIIQNAHGETISVYTPSGALLKTVKASDDYTKIEVPEKQIYLVKIANSTYKVALK